MARDASSAASEGYKRQNEGSPEDEHEDEGASGSSSSESVTFPKAGSASEGFKPISRRVKAKKEEKKDEKEKQ